MEQTGHRTSQTQLEQELADFVRRPDEVSRERLRSVMLSGTLFVSREYSDGVERLSLVTNGRGNKFLVAFSSLAALSRWRSDAQYGELLTGDVLSIVSRNRLDGLVLNPAGPFGTEFESAEVDELLHRDGQQVL